MKRLRVGKAKSKDRDSFFLEPNDSKHFERTYGKISEKNDFIHAI